MIKKVDVEELRSGVFIHSFGTAWLKHPFLGNHKLIKNEWEIERIRKYGISEVFIDTARGLNVSDQSINYAEFSKAFSTDEAFQEKVTLERSPWVPYNVEIHKAQVIKQKAQNFVRDLTDTIKMGKDFDIEMASEIVDDMVGSLARNRDAMLTLISIQNKDEYTFNHSINVAVMMASFSKYLGMSADEIKLYTTGALFHDLGKTMVPDEVLLKPGKYTDSEFKIMKEHPAMGKQILDKMSNVDQEIVNIVFEHHERMDGSGYPKGLVGHEISPGGRIAAIVDVYDALTSDRPYKNGDPPTDVLKYLFEAAPKHYDLELLQKFIQSVGIYPIGSLVRLSTGFLAIVVESPTENILKPTVLLIFDINKNRSIPFSRLDLSQGVGGLHQIVSTESHINWKIDVGAYLKLH